MLYFLHRKLNGAESYIFSKYAQEVGFGVIYQNTTYYEKDFEIFWIWQCPVIALCSFFYFIFCPSVKSKDLYSSDIYSKQVNPKQAAIDNNHACTVASIILWNTTRNFEAHNKYPLN